MSLTVQNSRCGKKPLCGSGGFRVKCYISLLLAILVVGCASWQPREVAKCISQNNIEKKDQYPIGQQGSIQLVDDPSQTQPMQQEFVAAFQFKGENVEAQELLIVPGTGKIPHSQKCDFRFELIDIQGNLLARYGIWNPRILIADEDEKKGFVEVPIATFVARFPFTAKAKKIRVLNAQNKIVVSEDLRSAIKKFCGENKDHPECRSGMLK